MITFGDITHTLGLDMATPCRFKTSRRSTPESALVQLWTGSEPLLQTDKLPFLSSIAQGSMNCSQKAPTLSSSSVSLLKHHKKTWRLLLTRKAAETEVAVVAEAGGSESFDSRGAQET